MSVGTTLPPLPPILPPVPVRRFTVDEYHQMIQAGIIGEDDNVELLEGWIVPQMARGPAHDAIISVIMNVVVETRLLNEWFGRVRSGMTTTDSEPEPDVVVVRGSPRVYCARHPGSADLALVIEVADSSLSRDRTIKGRIYAAASVPVYWIINLVDNVVEVYTDPTGPDPAPVYRTRQDYRIGDLVPLVIDGRDLGPIPAQELLP